MPSTIGFTATFLPVRPLSCPQGMVEKNNDSDTAQTTRRGLIVGAIAAAGLGGVLTGNATADDGSASGQIGTSAEPALHVYTEQVVYHPRTSDPSSPDDGTTWYRSDL